MTLKNYFDPARFWLLLKMELFRSRRGLFMTLVVIFGLLFFIALLLDCAVTPKKVFDAHASNYAFHLVVGGFILTSLSFNDLGDALKRSRYLTLPASTFEKFLCMWVLTSVGWIGLFTLTYSLYTFPANAIGSILFKHTAFLPFDPLGAYALNSMKTYFVMQGMFLVGAAHFSGYVFPKTLFVLIVFSTVCGVLAFIIMGEEFINHDCGLGQCPVLNEITAHKVSTVIQWAFWWVLAPVCWINTYWQLKEREV